VRWLTKCLIDNCKGVLPLQEQLRAWKHRFLGYKPNYRNQPGTLADALKQIDWLAQYCGTLDGASALEVGTGWEPLIPLVYRLAGAKTVYLTDSINLMCEESFAATLEFLSKSRDIVCASLRIPAEKLEDFLAAAQFGGGLESRLKALNLNYLAPCDCRNLDLAGGSLDIIYSRAVLEHIPEPIIRSIFRESKRLLRKGGVMCHFVDNSDHWEHRDKSISRVNFLRHSERVMRFTSLNRLNYQNRLRHRDYLNIMEQEGFRVMRAEGEIDQKAILLLPTMKLADKFKDRPHDDLATISSYLLAVS